LFRALGQSIDQTFDAILRADRTGDCAEHG
jgi:hypothetical protein